MLQLNITAIGFALAFLFFGVTNEQEGPIYLAIMIIFFVVMTAGYRAFENYLISKIEDW